MNETANTGNELQALENSILNTITNAVFGVQKKQIIFANQAAERIFGWKIADLLGKSPMMLFRSEEDFNEAAKVIYPALQKRGNFSMEVSCRHKNGRDFYCHLNVSAIDKDVINGKIVTVFEDITEQKKEDAERKKLEIQLIRSQKMEAVATLAEGIAHDFNNILMGIQGCASLLMMGHDHHPADLDRLKSIESLVQGGSDLTKQLFNLACGVQYDFKAADVNSLVENTASLFGRSKKGLKIHLSLQEAGAYVNIDISQMEQVLLNLLGNAWQSMPSGGDINLKTETVMLAGNFSGAPGAPKGKYIKISIEDSGCGMDGSTIERIFDPFFSTKEMGQGTGLGLTMVYAIVSGHKGIITVDSTPGLGTRFDIYLPAVEKNMTKKKSTPEKITRGQETILLVDDEDIIIDVNRDILQVLGYTVSVARSGQEAINIFKEKKDQIDLVIQDMVMPGMNGVDTFYALRKIKPDIKVILSSGYMMNQQIESVMKQGCRAFLQKPFRMEDLSRKVREVLDNA